MQHYVNDSCNPEWLRMLDSLRDDVQCVEFRSEIENNDDDEGCVCPAWTRRLTATTTEV